MNVAKSHITGSTFVIEDKGNGMMRQDDGSLAYDFACDGKPYTMVANRTDTCTGSTESGYDDVIRAGDKVLARQHTTFSADGKTMTVHETGIQPDGTTSEATAVYRRVSGTSGPVGKWMNTKADFPAESSVFIIETKGDWIKMHDPKNTWSTEGKTDGSNLTLTGPDLQPGVTRSITREGTNKLHETIKRDGKVTTESIQTLSADGKTIVEETWTPGKADEKLTWVWERQ
ncbi:MAG TPA: hypothetical protein VFA99_10910 [Acidobacteriaceae bacterium]|nr:hypothetical protein [Acidobacteriaceae bacterium]